MGAELFYRRLMTVADDYGRYHASVVTLRGACWPTNPERIREKDVAKWMNELLSGDDPLVKTYNDGGAAYLEIQDFGQQTRTESKFPDPPWADSDSNCLANDNQMLSKCESNAKPSRSRNTKSKTKANTGDGVLSFESAKQSELERELETATKEIHDRHPKHRACGASQITKRLRVIVLKSPAVERVTRTRQINRNHAKWCEYWARDPGSPFAKGLANWLAPTEGRFDDEPPGLFPGADEPTIPRRMI